LRDSCSTRHCSINETEFRNPKSQKAIYTPETECAKTHGRYAKEWRQPSVFWNLRAACMNVRTPYVSGNGISVSPKNPFSGFFSSQSYTYVCEAWKRSDGHYYTSKHVSYAWLDPSGIGVPPTAPRVQRAAARPGLPIRAPMFPEIAKGMEISGNFGNFHPSGFCFLEIGLL